MQGMQTRSSGARGHGDLSVLLTQLPPFDNACVLLFVPAIVEEANGILLTRLVRLESIKVWYDIGCNSSAIM